MNWQSVINQAATGNPEPPFKVERTKTEWAALLTPEAYRVTRNQGTEMAFSGAYCSAHQPGLYACVGCGQVLFDSRRKYESETGWPSFDEPAEPESLAYFADPAKPKERVEVCCNTCDAHLGHVFPDGPKSTTGLRFCINSAALLLLPERPLEQFNLQIDQMLQGERRAAPYTLLFVFRMDCPGCFLYGLNEAAAVHAAFDPGELEVLGLCTEFGAFDPEIHQKLADFLKNGQMAQAVEDAFEAHGAKPDVVMPGFPVGLDRISTPEDFLHGDTLQWFYSLNPNYPLLSAEDIQNIVRQANLHYRQLPMVAHTFSLNFMRGTPAFVLLNARGEKIADWLGFMGGTALVHQIQLLLKNMR